MPKPRRGGVLPVGGSNCLKATTGKMVGEVDLAASSIAALVGQQPEPIAHSPYVQHAAAHALGDLPVVEAKGVKASHSLFTVAEPGPLWRIARHEALNGNLIDVRPADLPFAVHGPCAPHVTTGPASVIAGVAVAAREVLAVAPGVAALTVERRAPHQRPFLNARQEWRGWVTQWATSTAACFALLPRVHGP